MGVSANYNFTMMCVCGCVRIESEIIVFRGTHVERDVYYDDTHIYINLIIYYKCAFV